MKRVLCFDIEASSKDPDEAEAKWFGAYSFMNNKFYEYRFDEHEPEIKKLIKEHRVLVGFNCKQYDIAVMERHGYSFEYKSVVDLWEVSKQRLPIMGFKLPNFKLKTIIELLKLDKDGKGEIDYKIFQKDDWSNAEIFEIKKYLKQDVKITRDLFEWFFEQFKPIRQFLTKKDKDVYNDVKASAASLAYRVICNQVGLKADFTNEKKGKSKIAGGHHVLPRVDRVNGHIVSIDFTSAYPHAIMMGNLLSPADKNDDTAWEGGEMYNLGGRYKSKEMGAKEKALQKIFLERLKAKKEGDKLKANSYKIIINSLYGTLGNAVFKHTYDQVAAGDTTAMTRTWMKLLGAELEEHGFFGIYGFTDSVAVLIPEGLDKNHLMMIVEKFVERIKSSTPFRLETFNLEVEKEMKFLWIVTKNCYLWINMDDTIEYRSTLFNRNTPDIIMQIFNDYMTPKIIEEQNVNFTEFELRQELFKLLKKDVTKAQTEHKVEDIKKYTSKTSLQYQISEAYGEGQHWLIPNLKGIGVGKAKGTKKRAATRYCTLKEFEENEMTVYDIDIEKMLKHLKPFYEGTEGQDPSQQKLF